MNNGIIYELINFDIIENEKSIKTKNIIYKALNTHPQYYLSLSYKKGSDDVICALVYTIKINRAIVIRDSLKNDYWVRYDYFVPINKTCLQKSNIHLNNPKDIVITIKNKRNVYKRQLAEDKKLLKAEKKRLKKSGIARGIPCDISSVSSKPRITKYSKSSKSKWNIKHPFSAGRGNF